MSGKVSTFMGRVVVLAGFVVASLVQAQPVRIGAIYSTSGTGSFLGALEEKVLRAPKHVTFLRYEELPVNSSGKIVKKELRARYAGGTR